MFLLHGLGHNLINILAYNSLPLIPKHILNILGSIHNNPHPILLHRRLEYHTVVAEHDRLHIELLLF